MMKTKTIQTVFFGLVFGLVFQSASWAYTDVPLLEHWISTLSKPLPEGHYRGVTPDNAALPCEVGVLSHTLDFYGISVDVEVRYHVFYGESFEIDKGDTPDSSGFHPYSSWPYDLPKENAQELYLRSINDLYAHVPQFVHIEFNQDNPNQLKVSVGRANDFLRMGWSWSVRSCLVDVNP